MRALEKFQRLAMENEESATNTETSVDVAVKVAEEVEAESQLAESVAVAEDAIEVSEEAAEDNDQLEMWEDSIRQHGVTPQGLQLMTFRGILASLAHRDLPAVESLSSVGRNPEAEQIALEAVQNAQKGYWQTLKNFLKTIWEKIQAAFSWLMQRFYSWEGNLKKMGAALSKLTIDDAKLREKKVKIMSHQQFGVLAAGVKDIAKVLDIISKAAGSGGYAPAAALMEKLGMTMSENGKIEEKAGFFEAKEGTLSERGWDKGTVESAIKDALSALQATAGLKAKLSSAQTMIKGVEHEVDSLEKSTGSDGAEIKAKRENIKKQRDSLNAYAKVMTKAMKRAAQLAQTALSAGSAVASCKA